MSGKLDARELAAIRWYLGQLLVITALVGTFAIEVGATFLVTVGLLAVVGACLAPGLIERLPALLWRVSPLFLLAVILADFLLSGGDLIPALFRMVILLTLYRAFQMRTPREDQQLLLLSLFLILITGVLSLEITFGLQMLVFAPVGMGLLFVANLSTPEKRDGPVPSPKPVFLNHKRQTLIKRLRERLDRRTLATGGLLYLVMTGMALLLFILLPRFDIGAALPFPRLQSSETLTGFSDHVQYGDVVSILNDDTIAMRVDVSMDEPPSLPYWRMVVLDAYYDGGFLVSPKVIGEYRTISNYQFDFERVRSREGVPDSQWTIYLEGGVSAYLPTGDSFDSLRFNNRIELQLHDLTRVIRTREPNATTLSMRYRNPGFGGIIPIAIQDIKLSNVAPLPMDTSKREYLTRIGYPETLMVVPSGSENIRILDEALEALGPLEGLSVEAFGQRLIDYLRLDRGYSLESRIPSGEADTLLRWLDSGDNGHCELYAGAFVLVSRYAGYPARLVTGFAGGDWNGFENYFMVRNRNAHAWCEIFDRSRGWIRMDPTPGYGGDNGSVNAALEGGRMLLDRTLTAYLDSLRILWYRRVVQFDSTDQEMIAESVKGIGSRGLNWVKDKWAGIREAITGDWRALTETGEWKRLALDGAIPVGLVLGTGLLLMWIRKLRWKKTYESRLRQKAGRLLSQFDQAHAGSPAHAQLLLIRYGPFAAWPEDAPMVLKSIRRDPEAVPVAGGCR